MLEPVKMVGANLEFLGMLKNGWSYMEDSRMLYLGESKHPHRYFRQIYFNNSFEEWTIYKLKSEDYIFTSGTKQPHVGNDGWGQGHKVKSLSLDWYTFRKGIVKQSFSELNKEKRFNVKQSKVTKVKSCLFTGKHFVITLSSYSELSEGRCAPVSRSEINLRLPR